MRQTILNGGLRSAAKLWLFLLVMFSCTLIVPQANAFIINVVEKNPDGTVSPINSGFRWLVEEDNTHLTVPGARVSDSISVNIHNSHAPVVAEGSSTSSSDSADVPTSGRYFVSVLPDPDSGYSNGGTTVATGANFALVVVNALPFPTAQISVLTHLAQNPINNIWDEADGGPGGQRNGGFGGVGVMIADAAGMVSQDAFGNPLGTAYLRVDPQDINSDYVLDGEGNPVVDVLGTGTLETLTLDDFNAGNNPYGINVGELLIKNLVPGKYGVTVTAPHFDDSGNPVTFIQTTTIEGTPTIDAWVQADEAKVFVEGFGTGFNHVVFGFVKVSPTESSIIKGQAINVPPWNITDITDPNYVDRVGLLGGVVFTGSITGTLRLNHFSRPPALQGYFPGPVVEDCWVGLNDPNVWVGLNDPNVQPAVTPSGLYVAPCDPVTGKFTINNVPPGTYQLVNWETPLDYLFGTQTVLVPDITNPGTGDVVDLGTQLVFRWFGNLEGTVFLDENQNGFRENNEPGLPNQDLALRFRDGTIYQATATDLDGEYSFAEVFPFFKWLVVEVAPSALNDTGYTNAVDYGGLVPDNDGWTVPSRGKLTPQPQVEDNPNTLNNLSRTEGIGDGSIGEPGAHLLQAMHLFLGQTNVIDWGKNVYTDGNNGGVSGVVFYAVTRAENDPRFAAGEEWEPGIPRVQVNLYLDHNADGVIDGGVLADIDNYPLGWNDGTALQGSEDIDRNGNGTFDWGSALNVAWTDSWDDNKPSGCIQELPIIHGKPIPECADGFGTWNQLRPGVFDGGYAITSIFPDGPDVPETETAPIPSDTYIVETAAPNGYLLMKEEDKNVDFGDTYTPSTLNVAAECVGDLHVVPPFLTLDGATPAPFAGTSRPLCDRKQVAIIGGQNTPADFWYFTQVPKAARAVGFVNNDLAAEFSQASPNFGEKSTPSWIPVSFQDFKGNELVRVYADEFGGYNALLPSTYTVNVPSPTGVSPHMIPLVLNDPTFADGTPDPKYDPSFAVVPWSFQYMPGAVSYLDTPIVPLTAFAASDIKLDSEPITLAPKIDTVNSPAEIRGGPQVCSDTEWDQVTLTSEGLSTVINPDYNPAIPGSPLYVSRNYGFGTLEGAVTLNGMPLLIDTWSDNSITVTVPLDADTGTLLVTRGDNGLTTETGVTLTVIDCGATAASTIYVRKDGTGDYSTIQAAIDAALPGDLIMVGPGTYSENVIMNKPVKLQGAGVGATRITANPIPTNRLQTWHRRMDALGARELSDFLLRDAVAANEAPGIIVFGETAYTGGNILNPDPTVTRIFNPGYPFTGHNCQAMIDGFTISGATGGGGIFALISARNLVISNNEITGNQGSFAGGITIGVPDNGFEFGSSDNVTIRNNKIHRNSGTLGAGGIALNEFSNGYLIEENQITGNFSRFNGGGIAHQGLSLGDNIIRNHDITFNEDFFGAILNRAGHGGGIYIGDSVAGGSGTGNVTIDGNLIQGNLTGSGHGGGIRAFAVNGGADVRQFPGDPSQWFELKIVNNIIANNVAALTGGGISLQDVARPTIVNNTIMNNDTTATGALAYNPSPGANLSIAQPAGIASGAHTPALLAMSADTALGDFSDPILENNIIWHNMSYVNNSAILGGAGGLETNGYWDLGVFGSGGAAQMSPEFNDLTSLADPALGPDYSGTNLTIGPSVVSEYSNALESATVIDEGGNNINVRYTPLSLGISDYHITKNNSPMRDAGTVVIPGFAAQAYDYDGEDRTTGTDIGADEFGRPIFISDPSGGETLVSGTTYTVHWKAPRNRVSFALSYNGISITTVYDTRTYQWTVPEVSGDLTTTLVITSYNASGATLDATITSGSFTIVPAPLEVVSPNGGEALTYYCNEDTLPICNKVTVSWTAPLDATSFDLRYDNGGDPVTVATDVPGRSYQLLVPEPAGFSETGTFTVVANNGGGGSNTPDAAFTVSLPVQVITPNGDELLDPGSIYTIAWDASGEADHFQLSY